jgi:hypothetical protein
LLRRDSSRHHFVPQYLASPGQTYQRPDCCGKIDRGKEASFPAFLPDKGCCAATIVAQLTHFLEDLTLKRAAPCLRRFLATPLDEISFAR